MFKLNNKFLKSSHHLLDLKLCTVRLHDNSKFPWIMLIPKRKNIIIKIKLHLKIILGFIVGFISAPMGIGGAVMNVPILKFFGYSINKAIGSAAAVGFLIALFGAIGFLISGSYLKTNLPFSIGFLNVI